MRVIRYFPESDMRNGHDGLAKIASKAGINMQTINNGEFVIFVNRRKTHIKMFASSNVIAHYKSMNGKIDPAIIQHLPNCFEGGVIDYDKAITRVLKKEFPKYFES